jgi:hypothetical protein
MHWMGVGIGRMLSLGVVEEALGDQMTDDNKGNQITMMRGDKDDNNNMMKTLQRQNDNDMIANNNQM